MNKTTSVFLILLRLALGWTILVEGLEKVQKGDWTSEPYLRESVGPLAPHFRALAGDGVEERLAVVRPIPGMPGTMYAPMIPAPLERDWTSYFDRFVDHYGLEGEQRQKAAEKLGEQKYKVVKWMFDDKITIKKTSPWGPPVDVEKTPVEWREEYLALRRKADEVETTEMHAFGKAADPKLASAKNEASKVRSELRKALDGQNAELQKQLASVLTAEQKAKDPPPYSVGTGWKVWNWRMLDWADASVKYGLTIAGVCLIVGLFSRTSAVVGACLLLLFYLAMPPIPGTPAPARAEGTYLYFNKTFVEVLALLVLATLPTGRWLGLDGLIHAFRRRREPSALAVSPSPEQPTNAKPQAASEPLTVPAAEPDNRPAALSADPLHTEDSSDGH